MAAEMSAQMKSYRDIGRQAALAEEASAKSAADAKTAAEQAAAVRADLQSKQSKLQVQIAVVKSQYTGPDTQPARGPGGPAADAPATAAAPEAVPPANDPGVLAAPPGGIPPGDMAPPADPTGTAGAPAGLPRRPPSFRPR